jgi:hypothetical protein
VPDELGGVALGELELCAITSEVIPTRPSANKKARNFIGVSPPAHGRLNVVETRRVG